MYKYLILMFLIFITTSAFGGEYTLSNGWSMRGQHYSIPKYQKNKCEELIKNVLPLEDIKDPIHCGLLDKINIPTKSIIPWAKPPIEKAAYIKQLLFQQDVTEDELKKEIRRMRTESRVIEIATIPFFKQFALATPNNDYKKLTTATLVKFTLGGCNDKTRFSSIVHQPVVYFGIAFKEDLSDIQMIKGEMKKEAFLWKDDLYFTSITKRVKDDTHQFDLIQDQPVIYIQKIYQGMKGELVNSTRLCRLLFWQKGQKIFE